MRKLITFLSLIAILALIWLGFFSSLSSKLGKETLQPPPKPPNAEKLFVLINEWRIKNGYLPYKEDSRLCEIAKDRSDDPFRHDEFFQKYNSFPYILSENLSLPNTFATENDVLNGWLGSKGHRENLEKPYIYSCVACDKQCVQIFSSFIR